MNNSLAFRVFARKFTRSGWAAYVEKLCRGAGARHNGQVRKRRLLSAILLAFVAVLAALLLFRAREPTYEGRPLSYWTDLYFQSARMAAPEQRKLADEAVRRIGTNSIPYLIERFEGKGRTRWNALLGLYSWLPPALRRFELVEK